MPTTATAAAIAPVAINTPKPADIHVGARVRSLRHARQMSQTTLATALGITFQQVQKYEKGTNRVSASMLFEIAHCLKTPISYFFEGLPEVDQVDDPEMRERSQICESLMAQRDGVTLAKTFLGMDTHARKAFMEFVTAMAQPGKT